jgi:hypothetical protein
MKCKKARSVNRHAGRMTQRRVLREPSQHATCLTGYLQTVIANDEADR